MCGLIAAIAERDVVPLLVQGLRSLEYRGYDSAGVATLNGHGLLNEKAVGKVEALATKLAATGMSGSMGIGHTRWATHGRPDEINAHPHISTSLVAVVHNGIIENHETLKADLIEKGYEFESETDTEVIAHQIHFQLQSAGSLVEAVQRACAELEGAYAIAAISAQDTERLVVARRGSPLIIGIGEGENFVASDANAMLSVTKRLIYLEEGDIAEVTRASVSIFDAQGQVAVRPVQQSTLSATAIDKGHYPHFMLKEIFEQDRALSDALAPGIENSQISASAFGEHAQPILDKVANIQIVACGTSYHAGLVGSYLIERLAGIPCRVEHASEYRYRVPVVAPNTLCIALSQSGETADTLAAVRFAKSIGYVASLAICNVAGSSLTREADLSFLTRAGPEIGVASTKSFTTQLAALNCLAILLARKNFSDPLREAALVETLNGLAGQVKQVLSLDSNIQLAARHYVNHHHALFLGRGIMYPVAMEGALKLKEISYIHAEAYPAGELKHGPLALVDKNMPVIVLAPKDHLLGKLASNVEEVRARGGKVLMFADRESGFRSGENLQVITMPSACDFIAPILYTIPLQLLSYYVATLRGTNVDQPRNLAKSVTVE